MNKNSALEKPNSSVLGMTNKSFNKKALIKLKYMQMPEFLFEIRGLSNKGVILYSMVYKLWNLSRKNDWVDETGQVYFYLNHQNIQFKRKGWSTSTITRAIKELENFKLLIRAKKKSSKFYLNIDTLNLYSENEAKNQIYQSVYLNKAYSETELKENFLNKPETEIKLKEFSNFNDELIRQSDKSVRQNDKSVRQNDEQIKYNRIKLNIIEFKEKNLKRKKLK